MKLWKKLKEKMLEHPAKLVCEADKHQTFREMAADAESFLKTLLAFVAAQFCVSPK